MTTRRDHGAVFVESILILPLFFLLAIGYIQTAQYLAARNQLRMATDQALEVAQRVSDLENESNRAEIERMAISIATAALISPDGGGGAATLVSPQNNYSILNLPSFQAGELETKLIDNPIRIELRARLTPVIPLLPAIQLTSQAIGFREPRRIPTNPIPSDCNGNVLGTSQYNPNSTCPCRELPCAAGMISQMGWVFDPATNSWGSGCRCMCNSNIGLSSDGQGGCVCSPGRSLHNGICDDDSQNCPSGQRKNFNTGACECGTGASLIGQSCQCSDPLRQYDSGSLTCVCRPAPSDQRLVNASNCTYACVDPSRTIGADGSCSVCANGYVSNGSNCSCPNDPSLTGSPCPAGSTFDVASCQCRCNDRCLDLYGNPVPTQPDNSGSCSQCPGCGANQVLVGRQCSCDLSVPCPVSGQTRVAQSGCSCGCPTGTTVFNNQCLTGSCIAVVQNGCPAGQSIHYGSGGSCDCEE